MSDNNIVLVGSLGKDPELSYTPGGAPKCSFSIAVNRRWMNKQTGEWESATSWFNVLAWGDLAENVASSLMKGDRAIVTGRLDQRQYEAKDGTKKDWTEIVADDIGASFRWATGSVTRSERSSKSTAGRQTATAPSFEDEEPF